MAWRESGRSNHLMVDKFVRLGIIESKQVENAFRCVSRAAFVPEELIGEAFIDAPIRGSPHLHMSAPHMYAAILEDLELEPGMSFLNVGSGTGYFSSLAGYMIKRGGINHGIELYEDLVKFANECVDDFIEHGSGDAKDICRPAFISGNCFRLDVDQMKYDRVYCGAACPQSKVRFLLELVRVGGFLIAPVGTRLIKLERISPREGRQTVITDVCFASLILPKPEELRLPKLRFPTNYKRRKEKERIKPKVSFPVGKSKSKKILARLRALQDVLECIETNEIPPLPFCYVPSMEQMNRIKMTENIGKQLQELVANPRIVKGNLATPDTSPTSISPSPSMRISRSLAQRFRGESERRSTRAPRSRLSSSRTSPAEPTLVHLKESSKRGTRCKDLPKDIWEHLSTDKTWLDVLEYYYSSCCTDTAHKKECFGVKALELCNNAEKMRAILSLSSLAKMSGATNDQEFSSRKASSSRVPYFEGVADGIVQNLLDEVLDQVEKSSEDAVTSTLLAYFSSTDALNEAESEVLTRALLLDNLPQLGQIEEASPAAVAPSNESVDSGILECSMLSQDVSNIGSAEDSMEPQNVLPRDGVGSRNGDSKGDAKSSLSQTTKSSRKSTKVSSRWVDVELDEPSMKCLQMKPGRDWSLDLDVELVCFLTKKDKSLEPNSVPENYPKIIRPELFAKQTCLQFSKISSYPGTVLAYRAILLKRVAEILDSVMEFVVGPSLKREQFKNPFEKRYPLPSFSDQSFLSSGIPLCFNSDIAPVEPVSKPKDFLENSGPGSELLSEVEEMISHEIANVAHQQDIIVKKLELIDSLDEQYKEQIRLLKQQIDLIEEQQQLLKDCEIHVENLDDVNREKLIQTQQLVLERKEHRQQLMMKLDSIKGQQSDQQTERYDLLQMRQQLVTLEAKLLAEKNELFSKGIKYLREDGQELSNFSKFVRKSGEILQKLKESEDRVLGRALPQADSSLADLLPAKTTTTTQIRYHPELTLSKGRFLLPLTSKRATIVKDFLRSSELPAPKHIPVISLDRRVPVSERSSHPMSQTIFMQLYSNLLHKDLHYRWSKKTFDQWWEVKFTGEGIIDQGGGFRDSLAEIADELCPTITNAKACLPLFIKTPNHRDNVGEYQDAYIPNPSCKLYSLYRWFGQLMGACYRTDETIPISFPPMVWKMLIEEPVCWKTDYVLVDEVAVRVTDGMELFDEETFENFYSNDHTFVTTLSDGKEIELVHHGDDRIVLASDRKMYADLVRRARMLEFVDQLKAIKDGLTSAVPKAVLSCLTWRDVERAVCGDREISVSDLKANCRYGEDLTPSCECVQHMWTALSRLTNDERSRFLRFITGRRRLPSPFIVSRSISDQDTLPSASTCGSNLFLPNYSNEKVAEEKLRYAIYHCVTIDTDTSPW